MQSQHDDKQEVRAQQPSETTLESATNDDEGSGNAHKIRRSRTPGGGFGVQVTLANCPY